MIMQNTFRVKWMHCASCAHNITKSLKKLSWVEECEVNVATDTAKVDFDPAKVSILEMNKSVEAMWYQLIDSTPKMDHSQMDHAAMSPNEHAAHLWINESKDEKLVELKNMKKNINILIPFMVLSFVYMILDIAGMQGYIAIMPARLYDLWHHIFPLMATYVLFVIGKQYIVALWRFIKTGVASMDTLIGLGTLVGFIYSFIVSAFETTLAPYIDVSIHYYDVVIVVIGFIYYGKYLETKSKLKTGEAIEKLLNLQAKTALIEKDWKEVEISIDQVQHNDIVLIKPWSKIPVDGVIISWSSSIDESMITGESMPIEKKEWDKVIGGTINKQWFLKVRAISLGSDSMLAHIIQMVKDAQWSRAPIQKLADQISSIFVPIVLALAVISLIVRIITGNFVTGIVAFVSVLVIACPCALWLATPTAIIVWVGKWAEYWILIKNAESLQKMHKVNLVIFDKTGTITKGKPELADYIGKNRKEDLQILASLEKQSEHPLAEAIVNSANKENIEFQQVSSFKMIEGKGVEWEINKIKRYAGNLKLMDDIGAKYDLKDIHTLTSQGKTPIFLATQQEVKAIFGVADIIKENIKDAIAELQQMWIKSVMLTGDNKQTAEYIASLVWIDDVRAEVLPNQKAEVVSSFKKQWSIVAMCGDGVNDAPALAMADVGVAMWTGTDVAIETADITLLSGDVSKLVKAIKLSKKTMTTIKQNLFWAFIYNIVWIPLAAGLFYPILLNPIFAGLAMAMSSVSVVANSLRLKKTRL